MARNISDFLSSVGMMVAGIFLLFVFTLSFSASDRGFNKSFPKSNPRELGGDVAVSTTLQMPSVPLVKDDGEFTATLTAFSALVIDDKTGTILYDKNSEDIRPLASITKIMSAIILFDLPLVWSSTTTVLEADCDTSSHQLQAGEIYTLEDLWSAALIGSSNSAVRSLVRSSGLTEAQFVARMNEKAKKLNFESLKFVEPTGLDGDNIGNARDVAMLLKEALRYEKISKTLKIGEYYLHPLNKDKAKRVWSTNWLLTKWVPNNFSAGDICGKTGFINDARYNFAVQLADAQDHSIYTVVLGSASNEQRFSEARDLANWIFDRYLWPDEEGYNNLAE